MKKILYLSPGCFDKGGISRYNRYQINALREIEGANNVKVFSLLAPQDGGFEEPFEVSWHASGTSKLSKLKFIIKVLQAVYFWKPDIIWLGHVNLTEILVRFRLFDKAKSILNVYGLEVWSGLRPKVEVGFRKVDYVVSDCHFTAKYIEDEGIREKASTEVIWDCVDLEKFTPSKSNVEDNFYESYHLPNPIESPWILTLGRLSFTAAHKGYERLMEVFSKVVETDDKSVLIFAGKGDMIDHLKQLANEFKVADRVYFSGMVHEDDLPKFYRAARVFSLVSDRGVGRGEGIPLTPLEAMACGSPIIVGNQDGSQEAIVMEKNGYCINPFDLEKHQLCIKSLIDDEFKFEEMSTSAIAVAREHFSYEGFREKHKQFLNKIDD
ncbi:glycosyltransferase family 4 protein [Gelidibacter sp. F63206]|uniref:glycosyltransferase family 4 protein n=1 Tax=Gelidibacter sp. F63206 TaxID=2926425 RepID=UPI001FF20276|nr:glycosyltransferase family 4 protein [Gelidibacter sp. F63206]MCK0115089.1 glycosyltransferase family 4 protein [Gelidibacter sp. F63206]